MNTICYKHFTLPITLATVYGAIVTLVFFMAMPDGYIPLLQVVSTAISLFLMSFLFSIEYNQTQLSKKVIIYGLMLCLLLAGLDYGILLVSDYLWRTFFYFFSKPCYSYLFVSIGTVLNLIKLAIALAVSYQYFKQYSSNANVLSTLQVNLITLIGYSLFMASPVYTWVAYKQALTSLLTLNALFINFLSAILLLATFAISFNYVYAWNSGYLKNTSNTHYAIKTAAFCLATYLLYIVFLAIFLMLQKAIIGVNMLIMMAYILAIPSFFFFLIKGQLLSYKIIHCALYMLPLIYVFNLPESLLMQPDYIGVFGYIIGYFSIVLWAFYGANQLAIKLIFK